jgi:hypothetical protein
LFLVRTILKLVGALILLTFLAAGGAVGLTLARGGLHDATEWTWVHDLVGWKHQTVPVGETGSDAGLRFEVTGFSCRPKGVDDECSVHVKVKNTGTSPAELSPELQYLRLDDIIITADHVDPGKALPKGDSTKVIKWDKVPRGGVRSIELHESLLSNGVRVPLGSG